MPRAVRFDQYGGSDVLEVREVERPTPSAGDVLVAVKAAGLNPGEISIREGRVHAIWPATFPSGEGSDLAGVVEEVGPGVEGVTVGEEVIGWTDRRASHADLVLVDAHHLIPRPSAVSWEAGGALFVAGTTAYAAVRAVDPRPGETVVVSGAAGGVGSLTVQLARRTGATVIGLASEANHAWLRGHGVVPLTYGDGVEERIRAQAGDGVAAFIDTFGADYVELALALGVDPQRVNTIINFEAVEKYGVKADGGATAATAEVLAELADLIARGELEVPIAATYPLAQVREAYAELAHRHTRGKIVLIP